MFVLYSEINWNLKGIICYCFTKQQRKNKLNEQQKQQQKNRLNRKNLARSLGNVDGDEKTTKQLNSTTKRNQLHR